MPESKGHKAEPDVEPPEAHQTCSRASEGEDGSTYVGATNNGADPPVRGAAAG